MAKTLLGVIDVCGLPFSVFEADAESCPHIEERYGYCDTFNQEIILDATMTFGSQIWMNTIVHEIKHAVSKHSGARDMIGWTDKQDEDFISVTTPHEIRALQSLRALKGPSKKKGRK
jgi:hypothetical protein